MITEHRAPAGPAIAIGRYLLHREIARGGMATVHLARLIGDEGFTRIVAAKCLHPELAMDHAFTEMFLAEARITSKLRHPNIVPVLDVVASGSHIVLVQEYVHGAPLSWLLEQARLEGRRVPIEIAVSIACQVLSGLHAAHVLTDELGQPLDVVHRDVSPHNVMIATDGTARLLDFGIAKTSIPAHRTQPDGYKGKIAYSAPEQLRGAAMPQSDVYSLAVVLWELLVGQRMYEPKSESELVVSVLNGQRPHMRETLWKKASSIPSETWAQLEVLEPIVERGLSLSIADRWSTAEELEVALRSAITPAPASAVAHWLKHHGKDYLELHERAISAEESSWRARPVRRAVGSKPPENSGLRLLPSVGTRAPRASLKMMHAAEALPTPPVVTRAPAERAPEWRGHGAAERVPEWRSHGAAERVPEWRGHGAAERVPEWRGHGAVIAVLCALIIAALAGIVLVMRASSQAAAEPSLVPASEPAQGIIFRPGVRAPAPPSLQRDVRTTASRSANAPATRAVVPRERSEVASPAPTRIAPATTSLPATRAFVPRPRIEVASPASAKLAPATANVPATRAVVPRERSEVASPPPTRIAPPPTRIAPATANVPATRAVVPRERIEVASPSPTRIAPATANVPATRGVVPRERIEVASPPPTRIAPAAPASPRPAARPVARAPAPPVRVVAKPPPPALPAVDCTLPYYYEGAKKHFKPACL